MNQANQAKKRNQHLITLNQLMMKCLLYKNKKHLRAKGHWRKKSLLKKSILPANHQRVMRSFLSKNLISSKHLIMKLLLKKNLLT